MALDASPSDFAGSSSSFGSSGRPRRFTSCRRWRSQVNNDNSAFLPASAPSTVAGNLAEPLVGKASLVPVIIIGVSQHGPISAADTQAITRLGR